GVGRIAGPSGGVHVVVGAGDLCASATNNPNNGMDGKAYLFKVTGARSPDGVAPGTLAASLAATFAGLNSADWHFGFWVCSVGDATGDGVPDLVVGAPAFGRPSGGQQAGRAYLFYGSTSLTGGQLVSTPATQTPGDGIVLLSYPNPV